MSAKSPGKPAGPRRVAVMIRLDYALAHHVQAFGGIQQFAAQNGWRVTLDPFADRRLSDRKADYAGVIARATTALRRQAARRGVPVVNVWHNSPVARQLPGVYPNGEAAGRAVAEHLLGRGLTRFGVLTARRDRISSLLLAGFQRRLGESGFQSSVCRIAHRLFDEARAWRSARESIAAWVGELQMPIGVFATDDRFAHTLADLCTAEHGIAIPHDLALIGAGNERAYCENPWIALSSIDLNFYQVGWRAAALLDQLMDGAEPPPGPLLVEPGELVPRQSTDVMAVDHPDVAAALRFIARNSDRAIQVQDVADAVATSRRTLQRRFRDKLGRSIAGQIEALRLERLKRLLVSTDEPVKSLAPRCGFRSFHHLYRAFVRVEGIPPNQYRKRRRVGG